MLLPPSSAVSWGRVAGQLSALRRLPDLPKHREFRQARMTTAEAI
jgi:hypothetical protein